MDSFCSLNLPKNLVDNLNSLNYKIPTEIQLKAIPKILSSHDIIAQAKTGSGKTLAFGIGIILKIDVKDFKPQALIICPTRELATQVTKELQKIARFIHNIKILNLTGGVGKRGQVHSLYHGAHIIVGTAGRLNDHLKGKSLNLENIKILVLDEADRMLDMGFIDSINEIILQTPKNKQSLFFSATFNNETKNLAEKILKNPIEIRVQSLHSTKIIKQYFFQTNKKIDAIKKLLYFYKPNSCIIFCNTKMETDKIADILFEDGFYVMSLHGDLEQKERDEVLVQFSNKSCQILVATDVASRGLDIDDIEVIINYDLPREKDIYTHRIGRTARAGKEGISLSLFGKNDLYKIDEIKLKNEIEILDIESLVIKNNDIIKPKYQTLYIEGGKKSKLRAGDILGAITKKLEVQSEYIGKIDIFKYDTFVAIDRKVFDKVYDGLKTNPIKGRNYRVWRLEN